MERTYTVERAAHARAVATEKGRHVGRPSVITAAQLAYATALRNDGATFPGIVAKTGLVRSTLYRHLPAVTLTAGTVTAEEKASPSTVPVAT